MFHFLFFSLFYAVFPLMNVLCMFNFSFFLVGYGVSERPLSDTNPLIQKQRNKTQTLIKKDQAAYPQKKKGKKKKKKKQTLKSKPYIQIRILSSRL